MKATVGRESERKVVGVIMVVAAGAASFTSDAAPTGLSVVDHLWVAAASAVITYAGSRSRRYPWLWLTGIATAATIGSGWVSVSLTALALALVASFGDNRDRVLGALVGGLSSIALLHLSIGGPHGLATAVGAVATGPVLWSAYVYSPPPVRVWTRRVAIGFATFVAISAIVFGVSALLVRNSISSAVDRTQDGVEHIRQGEPQAAASHLHRASEDFEVAADGLARPWTWPARFVPGLAQQTTALSTAAGSGRDVTDAAATAALVAPYQELKSVAGTIDLETMIRMQQPTAEAAGVLRAASEDVSGARSEWLLSPVAGALRSFDEQLRDLVPEADLAEQALHAAPDLLGGNGVQHYLVLFTSPAEARNLGGFVGSYGILTAEDGKVSFDVSGTATDLLHERGIDPNDVVLPDIDGFQERYGTYQPNRFLQNLTVSPDMGTTAEISQAVFEQALDIPIHGVMVVDPFAIAALLQLTGPVEAEGIDEALTSDNAADYLLNRQYFDFEDQRERKDSLATAGRATFEALTSRDLPGPRALGEVLGPAVSGKHLMFFPFDLQAQALFERLSATGRFAPDLSADFLSVRTADAWATKLNHYLHRSIAYDVAYDPSTGTVDATATIRLRNEAPPDGLADYILGDSVERSDAPPGTTAVRLAIYSPHDATGARVDGAPAGLQPQQELGARVYSLVVTIPPGGTTTVEIDLTGTISVGSDYRLQVLQQPMANDDTFAFDLRSASPDWAIEPDDQLTPSDGGVSFLEVLTGDEVFWAHFVPS